MSNATESHYTAAEWSAYADGELPAQKRDEMRSHLAGCADCAALERGFEAVKRGAEELARQSPPPSASVRTRLMSIGLSVLAREQGKRRLWGLIMLIATAAVLGTIIWFYSPAKNPAALGLAVKRVAVQQFFIYPPAIEYEVTIRNQSQKPLVITDVVTSDPFGEVQRVISPPLTVAVGQTVDRVFGRPVDRDSTLKPGRYRIWLVTSQGNLAAETIIESQK